MRHRRQFWVTVVALLCGVVATLVWTTNTATGTSVASDCARRAEESYQRQIRPTGEGRRVLVIGDSYSLGVGLDDPAAAWPSEIPGKVYVYGFGGTGFSRTAGICPDEAYDQRAPSALAVRPDLVIVEGGLNDYDQPETRIVTGYRHLMAELKGLHVVVVGPARAPHRVNGAERVDRILRRETERSGTQYVSMIDQDFDYQPDGVHPTAASQGLFGAIVASHLH